jgi:electron transfer flavoprotein alpha/beta subunit
MAKMLHLHDKENPDQLVLVNAEEIASVSPWLGGSVVLTGDSSYPLQVNETPAMIAELLEEK